jgi:hypothetical protein
MTDQHQHSATPEQWAAQQKWASPPDLDPYALCLLELRDRIAALEAAQTSTQATAPAPAGSLVERVANAVSSDVVAGDYNQVSRAAIREMAQAALQMHPDKNLTWERVALWLQQEADHG